MKGRALIIATPSMNKALKPRPAPLNREISHFDPSNPAQVDTPFLSAVNLQPEHSLLGKQHGVLSQPVSVKSLPCGHSMAIFNLRDSSSPRGVGGNPHCR